MFEVACPGCRATYQIDERRVPPAGHSMRCPKCGESFRVERPDSGAAASAAPAPAAPAAPPVLGAALGFAAAPRPSPAATPAAPPKKNLPPPRETDAQGGRSTMLGVAPQGGGLALELEDITSAPPGPPSSGSLDLPLPIAGAPGAGAKDWGLPELVGGAGAPPRLNRAAPRVPAASPPAGGLAPKAPPPRANPPARPPESAGLPALTLEQPRYPDSGPGLPELSANLPELGSSLPDLGSSLPDLSASLPDLGASLPEPGASLPKLGGSLPDLAAELPLQGTGGLGEGPRSIQLPSFGPGAASDAPESDGDEFGFPPKGLGGDDLFGTGPTHRPVTDPSALLRGPAEGAPPSSRGDEFDAFPTETGERPRPTEAAVGGVGYGEVALDGGTNDLALGDALDDAPRERAPEAPMGARAAATAAVTLPTADPPQKKVKVKSAGVSKAVRAAAIAATATVVIGGALSAFPRVGPFGAYAIIDLVRAGQYEEALTNDWAGARAKMNADTAASFDAAFRSLERGRDSAPRYSPRAALTAYVGLMRQLKFGSDTKSGAEAKALLDRLQEEKPEDVKYLEVARLAAKAVEKRGADALVDESKVRSSLEHTELAAEVLTREGLAQRARVLWQELSKANPTPRNQFGLARSLVLQGQTGPAAELVDQILKQSPGHVGAQLLRAELGVLRRNEGPNLEAELLALSSSKEASQFELSRAKTLEGDLLLKHSRLKQAEEAFNAALKLDAGNPFAQRGLANVLYEGGRYAEALARFEAAQGLQPEDLGIQLGIVRSKIRLEQHEDAAKTLARLIAARPESTAVQYWLGRSKEALGEKELAEKAYRKAVESEQDVPELVDATVSLTRLLSQAGRHDEAARAIEAAVQRFPEEPRVYRALGELSESRGNYEDAITNYERALSLDTGNLGVRFVRAIALRKARRFEEAARELDAVEQVEKGYPGLSLERGNLYEAAGRTAEALKAYESALSQAPNDPDLMLRVGCGKANAGRTAEAISLLSKVLSDRPMSAEVNFCLGLATFKEGKDLPTARRTLDRALSLDASRPEYHLYAGWVALDLKDYPAASREFDKALELDQSLADAYWLRGMLRVRQGAIADAERDLRKSLALSPGRHEAHATLAEAYLQMGKEADALAEFDRAAAGGALSPYIEYRYGKVLMDNHRVADARPHLERALTEKLEPGQEPPPWVWDAHRLLAMALGRERSALAHWELFLERGPSDSPYRVEAVRAMKAIMASLGH